MRLIVSLLLLAGAAANAATVTFENMPLNDSCGFNPIPCLQSITTPEGFVFSHTNTDGFGYEEVRVVSSSNDGNYLTTFFDPSYGGTDLRITHEYGSAFDLQSLDTTYSSQAGYVSIRGYDEFDNQVAYEYLTSLSSNWVNLSFDDSWNAVHSVVIEGGYFCAFSNCVGIPNGVDNFTASVVPIPAAAWLFGSALAGLGFIKRKQT
ncbi:MAG: VPLPA-CTERM sorting domain-containing protein [Gammaproteobacteria bacterium]